MADAWKDIGVSPKMPHMSDLKVIESSLKAILTAKMNPNILILL